MRMQGHSTGTGLTLQQKKSKLWGSKAMPAADTAQVNLLPCLVHCLLYHLHRTLLKLRSKDIAAKIHVDLREIYAPKLKQLCLRLIRKERHE